MPIEESKEEPVKDFFTTVKVSHLDQPQPSLIRPHRSTRATSWRNRRVARDSLKSGLNPLLKPLENRDLPSHPPIAYCEAQRLSQLTRVAVPLPRIIVATSEHPTRSAVSQRMYHENSEGATNILV